MHEFSGYPLALASLVAGIALLCAAPAAADEFAAGRDAFGSTCASCHTVGGGKLIGPDLKGVLGRRDEAWVVTHIKSPSTHREQNDPATLANIKEAGAQMPDLGLGDQQVADLVAYLKTTSTAGTPAGTPVPKQYYPTLALGALTVLGFTVAGLKAGSKKVEIR